MKNMLAILTLALCPAVAAAQDSSPVWADLAGSRPSSIFQGKGGQVAAAEDEEFIVPHMRAAISAYGRASFPGTTW